MKSRSFVVFTVAGILAVVLIVSMVINGSTPVKNQAPAPVAEQVTANNE